MMKIIKTVLVATIFLTCSNCGYEHNYKEFPKTVDVNLKEFYLDTTKYVMNLMGIRVYENNLFVITDGLSEKGLVQRYDLNTKKFIDGYSSKGNSRYEINRLGSSYVENNCLNLIDIVNRKIVSYNLDDKECVGVKRFNICSQSFGSIIIADSSNIIVTPLGSKNIIIRQNYEGEVLDSVTYSRIDTTVIHKYKSPLSLSISFDRKSNLVVGVAKDAEILYIGNLSTGEDKFIHGPEGTLMYEMGPFGIKIPAKRCFGTVRIAKDRIYAAYSGINVTDVTSSEDLNYRYIFVYDLDGNPIIKYATDKVFFTFDIDEKNNRIYFMTPTEEPQIQYFNL